MATPADPTTDPIARPLRCLHVLETVRLEHGGVTRAVLDYCTVLAERGHEVTLLARDDADAPADWKAAGGLEAGKPRVARIGNSWLPGPFLGPDDKGVVAKLVADSDVVHLHGAWEMANVQVARIARKLGVPYVVTVHGMLDDWSMGQKGFKKRLVHRLATRRYLDEAATVHCTAEGELAQARQWFTNPRTRVLPLLFDPAPFASLPGKELAERAFEPLRQEGAKVLFLSRLHPKKGAECLIDAVALLKESGSRKAQVLVAGSGEHPYEEDLRRRIREQNLTDRVHLLGMVKGPEKISLYEAADLFVLPTSQENFGIVFAEAMACGTPVVTTRGVDIWPELQRGGAEIIDRTAPAVADAIDRLLRDRQELVRRGQYGRKFILDWLDPQRVGAAYEQMYQSVITQRRQRGHA